MGEKRIPRPGLRIRLDHLQSAWFSRKFRATAEALAEVLPGARVMLDIGASHGKFAKELRRIFGAECRIFCVEPLSYNRSILQKIVGRWRNVEIIPLAFSDALGEIELEVPYKPSGVIAPGSTHMRTVAPPARELAHFSWRSETATATTLDAFVQGKGLERLDFVKIDVEGAVPIVLRGGADTLRRLRPAIFAEIGRITASNFGFRPEDTMDLLARYGYSMHRLDEDTRRAVPQERYDPAVSDYLFLPG